MDTEKNNKTKNKIEYQWEYWNRPENKEKMKNYYKQKSGILIKCDICENKFTAVYIKKHKCWM